MNTEIVEKEEKEQEAQEKEQERLETEKKGKEKRKEKQENDKKIRIIVTGGSYGNEVAVTTTEIISFNNEHLPIEGPKLNIARKHHAQVRMKDGGIFVCGGFDKNGNTLNSCEILPPNGSEFRIVSNHMKSYRSMHAAVCLNGGKICIIGGENFSGLLIKGCEIFDPVTESFSDAPYGLEEPMKCVSACLLSLKNDDGVFVCGERLDGKCYYGKYSPYNIMPINGRRTWISVNACSFIGKQTVLMVCGGNAPANATWLYDDLNGRMTCGPFLNVKRKMGFLADCGNGKIAVGGRSDDSDGLCLVDFVDARTDHCSVTFTDGQIMLKDRYGAAASKY